MNILNQYSKKKTIVILSTVLSGIYTLMTLFSKISSGNTDLSDYSTLASSLGSMITIIQIVFYVFVVGSLIAAVLSGVYFFTKNKKEYVILGELIGNGVNSLLLLLSIPGFNAACKVIKAYVAGDYSSIFTMSSSLGSMQSAANYLQFFNYISIILFIFNVIVLLIAKKIININGFEFSLDEPDGSTSTDGGSINVNVDGEKAKEAAQNGMNNVKAFLKTKNGKICLGVVALVIVAFGGYKIYDTYFNKTTLDVMPKLSVEFSGESGEGYITDVDPGDIEYDRNDANIKDFVNSIYYDYDYDYDLKNGDKVKITAVYDKEKAKQLNIEVKNDTAEVEVKGLTEVYSKASAVPDKIAKQIKKDCDKEIADYYQSTSYSTYSYEYDSMYFAYSKNSSDYAIAVYKLDRTSSYSEEVKTYYVYAYVSDVNSAYLDDKHYVYTGTLDDPNSYDYLTDPTHIKESLEDEFYDYKLTKFE